MTVPAASPEPLEARLREEITRIYRDVLEHPEREFHFFHGRRAAEMYGYDPEALDAAPSGSVASFAGVGNPHERADLRAGETVLDLGCGAGLDAFFAARRVGSSGRVVGVDASPAMCARARENLASVGLSVETREGTMESLPVDDGSVDVVLSNGVVNLSLDKSRVLAELFRVLAPGGRISITDIVSARPLPAPIKSDPKLWAS